MRRTVFLCLVALLSLIAAPAFAETRVALVIGNAAYKHAPALANPKHDAERMAASLKRLGFEVLAGTDLEKPAMEKLLQAFAVKLDTADVALVFYAGHGLQVHGRNYLVPVDGKLDRESDLAFQAVPLDLIQGLMEQSQRTNIMILDACRDNPLARNLARTMGTRSTGIGRGLGATQAGVGTLIVYATQPGNVALDGESGANSPFTAALLTHLETKGLEVRQVLTRVRQAVIEKTRGKQVPWDSSSLTGDFFFVAAVPAAREAPPAPGTTTPPATPPAATETPRGPAPDSEVVFWQSIQTSKNAADYKAYLEKYPNGTFAALAKLRIAEIEKAASVTPPAPASKPEVRPSPSPESTTRTSSYEPDVSYDVKTSLGSTRVANARECQATCLKVPYCTAWRWWSSGLCGLYSDASPRREQSSGVVPGGIVSGVVRGPRPSQASDAAPPQSRQALIRELMRKAAAREGDFTFCERTGWEPLSRKTFDAVWPSGGLVTFISDHSRDCIVAQMASELREGVRVLRLAKMWFCGRRSGCNAGEGEGQTWCRTSAGGYLPALQGQPIPDGCRKQ